MGPPEPETVCVSGVRFHSVTMQKAVEQVTAFARQADRPRSVFTGNLDHLALLQRDADLRAAYASADLILADGMPIVWLSRRGGTPLPERVTGSDLFWELAEASAERGLRLFFLGGAPGSALQAAEAVQERFPGARICGVYCPPAHVFDTAAEQARIQERIRAASPDILLVALGAPKQEKWIRENQTRLGVPVSIGVGGTFEMAGGVVRRAPFWMQKVGLEWAYRLAQEPRRLAGRYLLRDLPLLLRLWREAASDPSRASSSSPASLRQEHTLRRVNAPKPKCLGIADDL